MYVIEIRKGEERAASEFFAGYDGWLKNSVLTCVPVAWARKYNGATSFGAEVALHICKAMYPDCDVRFVDAVTTQPV